MTPEERQAKREELERLKAQRAQISQQQQGAAPSFELRDMGGMRVPVPADPQQRADMQEAARVDGLSRKERFLEGLPSEGLPDQMSRLASGGIGYADSVTLGNFAETEGAAAAYPTYSKNGAGILAGMADKAGLLPQWAGGGRADMADEFESGYEDLQAKAMADNPLSYIGGELGGYFVPGGAVWTGAGRLSRMLPGAQATANMVGRLGRVPSYLGRLGTSGVGFTADAALHGATVGASREEAATGQKLGMGDRAGLAKEYALTNVGDVADGFGAEVPGFLRGIPIAPALPVAGSLVERSVKGIGSAGKMVTPDRVQARALEQLGRAPSPNSTAGAMAEVIPGERVTGGTVKTFRFIENALRNGLKDSGLAPADITSRVTRGFNRIRESLPALADGRTTLAQLIEREFADAGSQVSENLRLFLLRVGLDDPAVTRGVIDEMRTGQVDDFRSSVDQSFGAQRQYDVEQELRAGLKALGETYEQILGKAKAQGNNSPLANSLREELADSPFKFELTEAAKRAGWKDVDTFINQDPWTAAHQLKSKLLSEARAARSSGNYEKYQEPATYLREMLNELPGYERMSSTFAKEAQVLDTLGHVKTLPNGEKVVTEGFGPQLRRAARKETETLRMADEYAAMPAREQDAAKISTGQVLKDQLRTARPGGTTLDGQDVMGLRLTDLQNEGVMSTNPNMPGALPTVFGEAGERVSQKVDDIVNSRKFLADIDPKTGSNTVNKANAQMSGDSVVTSGLPRTMTSGYTQSALMDATMLATGLPPVATMLTKGIPALGRLLGPGKATRAEIARTLMQRPQGAAPPGAPAPITPMSGRNRPRKWRKDPKWSDPNLTNPQLPVQNGIPVPGGVAADLTGGVIGGSVAGGAAVRDLNGDGKITPDEMFTPDTAGAALMGFLGGAGGTHIGRNVLPPSRGIPPDVKTNGIPPSRAGATDNGALPMDEASRMARAREMGFDTDQTVYHGTTHDFDQFGSTNANPEGHYGAGHYFTTSAEDASRNYAGRGPDLRKRISQEGEAISYEIEDLVDAGNWAALEQKFGLTKERIEGPGINFIEEGERVAAQRLVGPSDGTVIPAFVRGRTANVIPSTRAKPSEGRFPTYLEADYPDASKFMDEARQSLGSKADEFEVEELAQQLADEAFEPTGELYDFIRSVDRQLREAGEVRAADEVSAKLNEMALDGGVSAWDLDRAVRSSAATYAENEAGQLIGNDIIRKAFNDAGYDNIRMSADAAGWNMDIPTGTDHLIVSDPRNIRSKYAKFDPDKSDSSIITNGIPLTRMDGAMGVAGGASAGGFAMEDYNQDGKIDWQDWMTPEGRGLVLSGALMGVGGSKLAKALPKGNQRGAIDFDDPDLARRAQETARSMGRSVRRAGRQRAGNKHLEQVGEKIRAQEAAEAAAAQAQAAAQTATPAPGGGIPGGPLPYLAALGGTGTAGALAYNHMNQSTQASPAVQSAQMAPGFMQSLMTSGAAVNAENEQRAKDGIPATYMTPTAKSPRQMGAAKERSITTANQTARDEWRAEEQRFSDWLRNDADSGAYTGWLKAREKNADKLRVNPEDRKRGVSAKRLAVDYDTDPANYDTAPVEELVDGIWYPAGEGKRRWEK